MKQPYSGNYFADLIDDERDTEEPEHILCEGCGGPMDSDDWSCVAPPTLCRYCRKEMARMLEEAKEER
jgi:hypothetical protein